MLKEKGIFHRTELLYGKDRMEKVNNANVIIFGIGGVGSWCAESLVRSGIKNITIVDSDRICVTNINRQAQATCSTVGEVKTDALKKRLLDINPHANINNQQRIFDQESHQTFELEKYDFIIDAIDSLTNKVLLLQYASTFKATTFSSLGASLRVDPTRVKVSEFWKVSGCPLGFKMRKMMRQRDMKPVKDFKVVYSDEVLPNAGADLTCGTEKCLCPKTQGGPGDPDLVDHEWCSMKATINGTVAHITAIYGFTIAGLVMKDLYERCE